MLVAITIFAINIAGSRSRMRAFVERVGRWGGLLEQQEALEHDSWEQSFGRREGEERCADAEDVFGAEWEADCFGSAVSGLGDRDAEEFV